MTIALAAPEETVLRRGFAADAEVVVIGAKGSDFKEWENIAKVSILLAVDANKQKIKNYKFLKVMNFDKIISNKRGKYNFNITKNEDCSSLLEPNYKTHSKWII